MRRVILFIATSLDGYIARTSGEVDWLFTDQDYGYTPFFAQVDTVLMGRRTYEQVQSWGEYPYGETQGFVFSRMLRDQSHPQVKIISEDVTRFVKGLKDLPGKNIWLVGGAELVHSCLQSDLIDELIISVHPILLGEGIPLFRPPFSIKNLSFQHCEAFDTGLLQLTYFIGK
ncbi:MAG: dihydrofolate reductase family protein [Leptolyngbyaceae bacterium]|nr:dihydrofolate reductase family protein [Leptolyngbyaceae bacterium]